MGVPTQHMNEHCLVRAWHVTGIGISMWQKICKPFTSGKTVNISKHFIVLKFPSAPSCFVMTSQFVHVKPDKYARHFQWLICVFFVILFDDGVIKKLNALSTFCYI